MKTNIQPHFRFTLTLVALVLAALAGGLIPKSAYAAAGDLFVSVNGTTQNGGGFVNQYTPAGGQSTGPPVDRPRGVLFDNAGNLFVATTTLDNNSGNFQGTIFKITPGGVVSTFATGFGTNVFLEALVIDNAGNVFVMAQNQSDPNFASTIYEVTPGGAVSTFGSVPGIGFGLAFDGAGNLFAADQGDQIIYKFTPAGARTVFAGPAAFTSSGPTGVAFDRFGNLFVSTEDGNGNGVILEFMPNGTANWTETTFATGLTNNPRGIAFDGAGNLFVAEPSVPGTNCNQATPCTGDILEFAPGGGAPTVFASGIGRAQGGGGPEFLAFQPQHAIPGNLLASDNLGGTGSAGGSSILQFTPTGMQSTFVSNLGAPRGLAFDRAGNFFVASNTLDGSGNFQGTIFKITPNGEMSTFATGFGTNFFLQSVATDSAGDIFVMAQNNNDPNFASTIYKVTPDRTVSIFGNNPGFSHGLAFDSGGNLFAADQGDQKIYKFTPGGAPYQPTPTGTPGVFVGPEKFTQQGPSGVIGPVGLAFDNTGNLFVSTSDTNAGYGGILEFAPDGTKTTLTTGLTNNPRGIAFDGAGNLFVAEVGTVTTGDILKFTPGGTGTAGTIPPVPGWGIAYFEQGIGSTLNRGPEYLTFPPGETPVGSNVVVNTGTAGSAVVALTFPQVTAGGTTTVKPIDTSSAGTLPTGFDATNALAFDITTTAHYTTPIIIAFQVPSSFDVTKLHIFHNESGTLVDVTASNPAPNPTTHTIYASVSALSPFVIAKVKTPINMNQCKNGGWQNVRRANGTPFKSQGDCIQYVNTGK